MTGISLLSTPISPSQDTLKASLIPSLTPWVALLIYAQFTKHIQGIKFHKVTYTPAGKSNLSRNVTY